MKTLLSFTVLIILYCQTASAATITAIENGLWAKKTTWDLNREPDDNDIIIIPAGITVFLKNTPYAKKASTRPMLEINIYGILDFSDAGIDKLYLDEGSRIELFPGAKIQTSGTSNEIIAIYTGSSDNTVWDGTPTTINGPAYALSTTLGFINSVLPIKLISFDLNRTAGNTIQVTWATAEETNTSYFEIETYNDDKSYWNVLGRMEAAGNSSNIIHYTFNAGKIPIGMNQYRLKQVDIDGRFTYSTVRSILENNTPGIAVWYDRHSRQLYVKGVNKLSSKLSIHLYDINGINRFHRDIQSFDQPIQLPAVNRGGYVVVLKGNTGNLISKQIIVY